jgi:hypothetical protein
MCHHHHRVDQVCCCICNRTPVANVSALCQYGGSSKGGEDGFSMPKDDKEDDITFISFFCHEHTNDHQLTHDAINSGGVFRKILDFRKQVNKQ